MIRDSIHRFGAAARVGVGLLALLLLPALVQAQSVADKYRMARERQSAFNLSSSPTTVLNVNKWQCGLRNQGDTCSDVFNSPTGGGGFWPTGSPNQYMFNSGIQVLGINTGPFRSPLRSEAFIAENPASLPPPDKAARKIMELLKGERRASGVFVDLAGMDGSIK